MQQRGLACLQHQHKSAQSDLLAPATIRYRFAIRLSGTCRLLQRTGLGRLLQRMPPSLAARRCPALQELRIGVVCATNQTTERGNEYGPNNPASAGSVHCTLDQAILSADDCEVESDCRKAAQGARQKRHGEYAMILGGHYPEETRLAEPCSLGANA
jgi:hypothetical protein